MKAVSERSTLMPPFVGRGKEIDELRQLHRQERHALILGAKGVGKSALINHLQDSLGLLVCHDSEKLSSICDSLENGLGVKNDELMLPQRKGRALRLLFIEALQHPMSERDAFLDRACAGDNKLRLNIEALLRAHERVGGFMETPLVGPGSPSST